VPRVPVSEDAGGAFVAIGGSETFGLGAGPLNGGAGDRLRGAWPQVFFHSTLPREMTLVNLGEPGATVADALATQLPTAVEVEPAVATVWLNVNDIINRVPPGEYEDRLGDLVHRLRRGGRTRVLVANTPQLDRLPAYQACLGPLLAVTETPCPRPDREVPPPEEVRRTVDAYNDAVDRVAAREGGIVVDLHGAGHVTDAHPEYVAADGFHPSVAGHRAIAERFAAALGPWPPPGG
jgi:lysophospholipase L1-like esterase